MKLHENNDLFIDAVKVTAQQMNLPEIYVEKDYWITYALHIVFSNPVGEETIFKGGTALSKCFNLIKRFSEDIDLVVLRREDENDNQMKKKLKTISKIVAEQLPEIPDYDLTHKRGMIRKTAHSYIKQFNGEYGQVRDAIVVEATWFGYYEPFTIKTINSFVGDMMITNGKEDIAKEYALLPFKLKVLEPTRTICEKIMSLVRFSYTDKPIDDLKNKVRHIYDLHMLLQNKEYLEFFNSKHFVNMFLKVATDDIKSFKNNNYWLNNHPKEALIFSDLERIWKELIPIYNTTFKSLTYDDFPDEIQIINTLNIIRNRIKEIEWNIKTN